MRGIHRAKSGFTLIELLVVIAIIGILAALLLPVLAAARCRAKEGATQSMIRQIESACVAYHSDFGIYPLSANDPIRNAPNSGGLIAELRLRPMASTRAQPYYDFKANDCTGPAYTGNIQSALGLVLYYQENDSVRPKGNPPAMMKPMTQDVWTGACDSVSPGNPGALKTELNVVCNWR